VFAKALDDKVGFYKEFTSLLMNKDLDQYVADKAAYLLTAIMCHSPQHFSADDVNNVVQIVCGDRTRTTEVGTLDAITNLLKFEEFRQLVFKKDEVLSRIFAVKKTSPAPLVYKSIFCVWLISFDKDAAQIERLRGNGVILHLKGVLQLSRAEKVIRVCLMFLKNALEHKNLCEDIVEKDLLEAVQALEYEKWRDAELYDEIRTVSSKIQNEVAHFSNFDRYERELESGSLNWGFIHSDKFWAENVMKFEAKQFGAVKTLAAFLKASNATTLAVACHDLGEFVQMHPLGKRKVLEFGAKDKIMELMGHTDRDVRREALLCCQKIMLNKWADLPTEGAAAA
jgi:V-type H+-transporting ATPase subunit H